MKNKGLTLIELAIVLAICGILAAIGGVSYHSQSNNQRLNAMKAALVHLEAEQANHLLLTQKYATSLPGVFDSRFLVHVVSADSRDYMIKAKSVIHTGDGCDELVVTRTSRTPEACWR